MPVGAKSQGQCGFAASPTSATDVATRGAPCSWLTDRIGTRFCAAAARYRSGIWLGLSNSVPISEPATFSWRCACVAARASQARATL